MIDKIIEINNIVFLIKEFTISQNDINHIIFETINSIIYIIDDDTVFKMADTKWIKSVNAFIIYIFFFITDSILKNYKNTINRFERVNKYW